MYCAKTRVIFVRLINTSNKFFEKILGEWTICEAEKLVIKFAEKGKRKEKTGKVVKLCSRKRKTFALHIKIVKPDFSFTGLCPFNNKCSLTINCTQGFLNSYYQCGKSQDWTHWFNRDNYELTTHSLFVPFKIRFVFNREGLPFLPLGYFSIFFFINSTLNLCLGVIACMTGVIFWRFSGERGQAQRERGALPPSLVSLSNR